MQSKIFCSPCLCASVVKNIMQTLKLIPALLALSLCLGSAAAQGPIPGRDTRVDHGPALPTQAEQYGTFILTTGTPSLFICNASPCMIPADWLQASSGSGSGGSSTLIVGLARYALTPAPDGTTVAFTAPIPISANALVIKNGTVKIPGAGADYTVSGNTITFTAAPFASDILVIFDSQNAGISGMSSIGATAGQIWSRVGTVLPAGFTADQSNLYEPSVIHESGCVVLTSPCFKAWFTAGWGTTNINYAESLDGVNWTRYLSAGVPVNVVAGHARSSVFKKGSTYYMYATPLPAQNQIDQYTSSDGVTWTLAHAAVLTLGAGGHWDDTHFANTFVWVESGPAWNMIYEANHGGNWSLGLATSTDGITWAKSGSNPILSNVSAPFVYPRTPGSLYYLWVNSGFLPSDIWLYSSTNLTTWTKVLPWPALWRTFSDEGPLGLVGQVADPFLVEVDGQTYFYYTATVDGSQQSGAFHLKLAVSNTGLANAVVSDPSSLLNGPRDQSVHYNLTGTNFPCSTANTVGAICQNTLVWDVPYKFANDYRAVCQINGVAQGSPILQQSTLQTATSVNVVTMAITAAIAQASDIQCIAIGRSVN